MPVAEMKKVIVVGGLNTDIIARGVDALLKPGELTRSGELVIGPGGKSRNIAQMIATYQPQLSVHMIGKTARDAYGLWQSPYLALQQAGVCVDAVEVLPESDGRLPGIALIPVDTNGRNQIYCLPGVNDTLCEADIQQAKSLFEETGKAAGVLAISLEMPLVAAVSSLQLARRAGVRAVVDPGGISAAADHRAILEQEIFLLKPNQHEIAILSGTSVNDLESARAAARQLMDSFPIRNILVTNGARGSYLITRTTAEHLPVSAIGHRGDCDETGCGDQVTAVMAAEIALGTSLREAARRAMVAGLLQFQRIGISPVTSVDVNRNNAR
jgi:sugar/nucleoside kinase (ribokinase family)